MMGLRLLFGYYHFLSPVRQGLGHGGRDLQAQRAEFCFGRLHVKTKMGISR